MNEFDQGLWENASLARLLTHVRPGWEQTLHRKRILLAFDGLSSYSPVRRPVFFFVDIVSQHAPWAFGKIGETVPMSGDCSLSFSVTESTSREIYGQAFRAKMEYAEKLTLAAVRHILQRASSPPIIIIEGDHGPALRLNWEHPDKIGLNERLSILNALQLPRADSVVLTDSLIPVNTFRIVFNRYIGTRFSLLPNHSMNSPYGKPYKYMGNLK